MRSTYKLFCLTVCVALLISISTFTLTGCRDNNIPASVPSVPQSSSTPSVSSSSAAPVSESSDTTASEVSSSSNPVSSSKPAPSSSTSAGGTNGSGSGSSVYSGRTYSKAVTDSKKETLSSVKITKSGVYLSNKTITGDLIIDKGVADGKVTLENVTVGKTIYVYGGGENSIYLKSVKAAKLISASTVSRPRIVAQYSTNIGKTEVRYDTLLECDGLTYDAKGFSQIETVKTSQFLTVLKLLNIGAYSLIINDDTNLFLKGTSSVSYLTANSPAYIEGAGAIGTLECNSKNITVDYSPNYITSKSSVGYYSPTIINSSSSSTTSGTTTTTLGTPYLSGSSMTSITWSQVSGAELGYEVRVNLQGTTTYTTRYFSPTESRTFDLQNHLTTQGAPAGWYEVRVKTCATASKYESSYSNMLLFNFSGSTTTPIISGLTFSDGDRTKYILSWTSTNASSYNVTVKNSSNVVKLNKEITNSATKMTDLRADMGTANFVAGDYTVTVTAKNLSKQASATGNFTVTVAPTPTGFSYNTTSKTVTWSGSTTASYYKSGKTGVSETTVGNQYVLDDATYPPGSTYTVSVKQLGSVGYELDSAIATYAVNKSGSAVLPDPTGVALTRVDTDKLKLNWGSASGAQTYIVSLNKGGTPVPGQTDIAAGNVNTYTFSYVAGAGSYTATVKARATGSTDSSPASSNTLSVTADDLNFEAGLGTYTSPYEVKTAGQFSNVGSVPAGKYFIQTGSFTVSNPISNFQGNYDGKGTSYNITVTIGQSGTDNVGLFRSISSGATVANIKINEGSYVNGTNNVGMIAGSNAGAITSCSLTPGASCNVTGTSNVGGICGTNTTGGTVTSCSYSGKLFESSNPTIDVSASPPTAKNFGTIIGNPPTNVSAGGDGGITSLEGVAVPDAMAIRLLPWLSILSRIV